ncbi:MULTISPECIES: hypothetical protein [unclassified Roseateles]|uniref:hypothetical protein n=1 Tax=unclassified Roseateles TaxID=2626991 RepID=UPI0007020FD9|nr:MULTISPECIES: hypothetical protein [unclassified Roseateles]KQW49646.1 hypothetical protein ASC81_25475 [Pelomonas sp. Root405]KRA76105.1 hypothetical protein ASD88_25425 [Pelomonas sp. Root662]
MKLLPIHPALAALLPRLQHGLASPDSLPPQALPVPAHAAEPDWRNALLRLRARDEETTPPAEPEPEGQPLATLPVTRTPPQPAPDVPVLVGAVAPSTPTTEKVVALQQLAEANTAAVPVARTWQVDLPATAAGQTWQLHVEQAQPLAPLNLELRVPPVAQSQARQQLSDLDKRLREVGHDVLRPRLTDVRSGKRFPPLDEVEQ